MSDASEHDRVPEEEASLLSDLGLALGPDLPPAGLVTRAQGLVAFMDVDRELVELLEGSGAEPADMRGPNAVVEQLTFETADGAVALEIVLGRGSVTGQVLSGAVDEVALEHVDGTLMATVIDDLGRFSLDQVPVGTVRLRLQVGSSQPVRTDWFLL